MARIERFEDIEAWKRSRELTNLIYQASGAGRFAKDFALKDQIRRVSISTMSNIAEGFERGGDQEFIQHLAIAKGSCGEMRAQLYIALDQGYLSQEQFQQLCQEAEQINRMIAGFMTYLQKSPLRGSKYKQRT
jgi:four helix bundle protein